MKHEHVICNFCGKIIYCDIEHIKELGGMFLENGEEKWFCTNNICIENILRRIKYES